MNYLGLFAGCSCFSAVFSPEQWQGNPSFRKLPVGVRVIHDQTVVVFFISVRTHQGLQDSVCDIIQRPPVLPFTGDLQNFLDGAVGTVFAGCDLTVVYSMLSIIRLSR